LDGVVKDYSYKKEQIALWDIFLKKSRIKFPMALILLMILNFFKWLGHLAVRAVGPSEGTFLERTKGCPGTGAGCRPTPGARLTGKKGCIRFVQKRIGMV
jgi:hypothetical protein